MNTKMWAIWFVFGYAGLVQAFQHGGGSHSANSTAGGSAWAEFTAGMTKMHAEMNTVKASGSTDEDFVKLMLPHHQAAIDMARTQLASGKDPQMRRLAQEIVTEQQLEIELMRLWLKRGHGR